MFRGERVAIMEIMKLIRIFAKSTSRKHPTPSFSHRSFQFVSSSEVIHLKFPIGRSRDIAHPYKLFASKYEQIGKYT